MSAALVQTRMGYVNRSPVLFGDLYTETPSLRRLMSQNNVALTICAACRRHETSRTPHKRNEVERSVGWRMRCAGPVLKARNLNNPTQAKRSGAQCGVATAVRELRARGTLLIIPQKITFVNDDTILFQQGAIFFCKRESFVVFLLSHDIVDDRILFT